MESISNDIKGKKIVLLGSYGWGNGELMQDWEERIISNEAPSAEEIAHLSSLGDKYFVLYKIIKKIN